MGLRETFEVLIWTRLLKLFKHFNKSKIFMINFIENSHSMLHHWGLNTVEALTQLLRLIISFIRLRKKWIQFFLKEKKSWLCCSCDVTHHSLLPVRSAPSDAAAGANRRCRFQLTSMRISNISRTFSKRTGSCPVTRRTLKVVGLLVFFKVRGKRAEWRRQEESAAVTHRCKPGLTSSRWQLGGSRSDPESGDRCASDGLRVGRALGGGDGGSRTERRWRGEEEGWGAVLKDQHLLLLLKRND